jgi:hypothetical protein
MSVRMLSPAKPELMSPVFKSKSATLEDPRYRLTAEKVFGKPQANLKYATADFEFREMSDKLEIIKKHRDKKQATKVKLDTKNTQDKRSTLVPFQKRKKIDVVYRKHNEFVKDVMRR